MADYVDTRRVGEARVTSIRDAADLWIPDWQVPEADWRPAMPEADAGGEMPFDMSVFHIALGDASVLVDLGFGDAPDRYMKRTPHWRSPGVVAGLATIGVRPADVTHVAITHTHGDHIMGATVGRDSAVATFPRARHLLGRAERGADSAPEWASAPEVDQLGALERLGLLDLVDGEHPIASGIDMLHAPGESAGHSILRVRSGGESFYCLGDLFHHVAEVEHLDWLPAARDPVATASSRQKLVAEALASRALCAYTHQPFPCWGRIVPSGDGQRWDSA